MVSLGKILGNTGQGKSLMDVRHSLPSGWEWRKPTGRSFRCEIRLCVEPEGGYSVYSPSLPGVVSEGDNAAEATKNIVEALQGALATYLEDDGRIPWKNDTGLITAGETRLWIVVNV